MSKKNSQISNDELNETKSDEQITGELVDSSVNPDGITIDNPTEDSEKNTVVKDENVVTNSETPIVENPTPDATVETPVADEQKPVPVVEKPTPDTVKTPVDKGTGNKTPNDAEPIKIDEFKRFYIRFGYSIDSRSTTTRRTLSTTEIVKQFVKAPTCFIAFETKEDLKDFETLLKIKTIKVEDKEGKLVDFPDAAKKHLIERVTELSKYWISRNSK